MSTDLTRGPVQTTELDKTYGFSCLWVPFSGDLCGIFMDLALKSGRQTSPRLWKDLEDFPDFVHLFAPLALWGRLLSPFRPQEAHHFLGSISAERSCEYPRARNEKIFNQKILLQLGDLRLGSSGVPAVAMHGAGEVSTLLSVTPDVG